MSEPEFRPAFRTFLIAGVMSALAGFTAVYVSLPEKGNGPAEGISKRQIASATKAKGSLAKFAQGDLAAMELGHDPRDLPEILFNDGQGAAKDIKNWNGKIVLLNLWATWCPPCLREMPSLDRLQAKLGSDDFEVVALSIDKGGAAKPARFLKKIKTKALTLYNDPTAKMGHTLKVKGMPTTLLIDRQGREIGRLTGPAEWDSPDAIALIKAAIEQSSGS